MLDCGIVLNVCKPACKIRYVKPAEETEILLPHSHIIPINKKVYRWSTFPIPEILVFQYTPRTGVLSRKFRRIYRTSLWLAAHRSSIIAT